MIRQEIKEGAANNQRVNELFEGMSLLYMLRSTIFAFPSQKIQQRPLWLEQKNQFQIILVNVDKTEEVPSPLPSLATSKRKLISGTDSREEMKWVANI